MAASPTRGAAGALVGRAPERSQTASPRRTRLLVLAGIVLTALNLRTAVTSVSPVLTDVRADLELSTVQAGLLGTVPPFAFAVFGALTPVLIRRVGLERAAWAAMALAAAGQLLRVVVADADAFLLLSLVALGGMGIGNVVLPPLVKRHFPDRIGAVTGAYVLLLTAGTTVPPLVAVPVADAAGWRVSVGQWALFAAVAAVPWLVLAVRQGPATAGSDAGPASVVPHVPLRAVVRSKVAWGLAGLIGTTSLNTYAVFAWLPSLLVESGSSEQSAAVMLAVYAGVGMPAALVVPWLAARMRNPLPIVVVCLLLYGVAYTGLALAPGTATVVWVVAAGLAPAAFPLALALVNLRSRTPQGSAALAGFSQGIGYTMAGLGPLAMAALREGTGGWDVPMAFLAATLLVQVAGGVVVCRPRMVEDDVRLPVDPSGAPSPPEVADPDGWCRR